MIFGSKWSRNSFLRRHVTHKSVGALLYPSRKICKIIFKNLSIGSYVNFGSYFWKEHNIKINPKSLPRPHFLTLTNKKDIWLFFKVLGLSKSHFKDRTYSFWATSICLRWALEWINISGPLKPMLILRVHFWNEKYISKLLARPHFLTLTNNIDICLSVQVLWFSQCFHSIDKSYRFWIRALCAAVSEVHTLRRGAKGGKGDSLSLSQMEGVSLEPAASTRHPFTISRQEEFSSFSWCCTLIIHFKWRLT